MDYPYHSDVVWLATDRDGAVGAFISAGEGPIPMACLNAGVDVHEVEDSILGLPVVSASRLEVVVPKPDSFLDLAARGLYVFDWQDVHRTFAEVHRTYDRVAVPVKPLDIEDLPDPLRSFAGLVRFLTLRFADSRHVSPESHS